MGISSRRSDFIVGNCAGIGASGAMGFCRGATAYVGWDGDVRGILNRVFDCADWISSDGDVAIC